MDDTLRNIAIGLFAFLGLHGGLHERERRAAERQVSAAFDGTGRVRATIAPRGFFGLETNDLYEVDIDGSDIRADRLPFYIYPRGGWKGDIRFLRLRLRRFTLRNVPIREFSAELPHVTYDLGHALYQSKLVLRGAGVGRARVTVGVEGLLAFIRNNKRFQQTLSDVNISFQNGEISVSGNGNLPPFGVSPFTAVGKLKARDGRYLDLDPFYTVIKLNGIKAPNSLINLINPVVDIADDLGLKGYFSIDGVAISGDELIISGTSTLPVAPPGMKTP